MTSDVTVDAQPRMPAVFDLEIREERRVLKVGIIPAVRLKRRVRLAVDKKFKTIAVGEDGSILAGTTRRRLPEVPVEVGDNHRLHRRTDLRLRSEEHTSELQS